MPPVVLSSEALYTLIIAFSVFAPLVVSTVWRLVRPGNTVPFWRYVPHLFFLMLLGGFVRPSAMASIRELSWLFGVSFVVWVAAVTILMLLRGSSPRQARANR